MRVGFVPVLPSRGVAAWRRSSAEALRRFSSGDLQSECDEGEVDPYTGRPATTSQPKPQNQRPVSQGELFVILFVINKLFISLNTQLANPGSYFHIYYSWLCLKLKVCLSIFKKTTHP